MLAHMQSRSRRSPATRTSRSQRGAVAHAGRARAAPAARPADDDPHVTAVRRLRARGGRSTRRFRTRWTRGCEQALRARGIDQLYTHQAEAIAHALGGRNVVVVTPTASGKTLCYNAPVLQSILQDPSTRALYLFPTKALAQDQLAELHQLAELVGGEGGGEIGVFTYDGDTPQDARRAIRGARARRAEQSRHGALGHPAAPSAVGEALREPEVRRHRRAARVSRRVRQPPRRTSCGGCGASAGTTDRDPTFICSSATIANPRELAERLIGAPFELVDKSGAPRGEKFFLFVNPPVVNAQLGIRRSYLAETRRVAIEFLKRGLQLDRLRAEPAVDGDPDDLPEGRVSGAARARPT